jgi:hypothetical protein
LRVFLNGMDEQPVPFTGGVSVFHVPFLQDPVSSNPRLVLRSCIHKGTCAMSRKKHRCAPARNTCYARMCSFAGLAICTSSEVPSEVQ